MSNAVASRSREEARDSESIFMSNVIILFALFYFLTLVSDADDEDIYCERQQGIILAYAELNYY